MKIYVYTLCIIIVFLSFSSCTKRQTRNEKLLYKAQKLAEEEPSTALMIIDSITDPEKSLSQDCYMQYIVTKTQIRFNNGLNIEDNLTKRNMEIAINYFLKHDNVNLLALAYLYIGNIYNMNEERESAFLSYKKILFLPDTDENLCSKAKSLFNIGLYYYFNCIRDSAEINWERSLQIFSKLDKKTNISQNLYSLAMVNYLNNNIALSKKYAAQSLTVADEINNNFIIFNSLNLLATLARDEKKYSESLMLFNEALNKGTSYVDTTKNYIGTAETYIASKNMKAASKYIDILKERFPNTCELYTLLALSTTLKNYYKEIADIDKVYYYEKLSITVQNQIDNRKITSKLYEIDKKWTFELYKKEETINKSKYIYTSTLSIVCFVILFISFKYKITRRIGLLKISIKQLKKSNYLQSRS